MLASDTIAMVTETQKDVVPSGTKCYAAMALCRSTALYASFASSLMHDSLLLHMMRIHSGKSSPHSSHVT